MADYNVRRESLITPWGVGAIVPFPHDESLMVAGTDYWFDANNVDGYKEFEIEDARLTKRLGGKLFVMPPDFRKSNEDELHCNMKIPAVRFPRWHYCPVCGNMEKLGDAGDRKTCSGEVRKQNKKETFCHKRVMDGKKAPLMVPERFVAVCEDGHIEDFPLMEWVHAKTGGPMQGCKLVRSTGGNSSSLAGVRYTCTCGASRSLAGAFGLGALDSIGYRCTGNRPWLGHENKESCGKQLQVLQRGASNVWFANIISSIYIPWLPMYTNQATRECVEKTIKYFQSHLSDGAPDEESVRERIQNTHDYLDDSIDVENAFREVMAALGNKENMDADEAENEYRRQEFEVLTKNAGDSSGELYVKNYPASRYDGIGFLRSVSMVHKLRETRAFTGFRRLYPDSEKTAPISIASMPWIPAVKNSGEGIMLEFDPEVLSEWAENLDVKKRVSIIEKNMKDSGKLEDKGLNPVFILLHTLAHCLINALANQSGYSSASIREKIYCRKYAGEGMHMAGILIYTASGDSEGSLGGLVRQAASGRLEEIVKRAVADAAWCASDPVCIQSTGQGQDGCNLAACHNCALLPETSCENKNMLLDRGLLIGTLDNPDLGFFSLYKS